MPRCFLPVMSFGIPQLQVVLPERSAACSAGRGSARRAHGQTEAVDVEDQRRLVREVRRVPDRQLVLGGGLSRGRAGEHGARSEHARGGEPELVLSRSSRAIGLVDSRPARPIWIKPACSMWGVGRGEQQIVRVGNGLLRTPSRLAFDDRGTDHVRGARSFSGKDERRLHAVHRPRSGYAVQVLWYRRPGRNWSHSARVRSRASTPHTRSRRTVAVTGPERRIPQSDGRVLAAAGQRIAIRVERQRADPGAMVAQRQSERLARARRPTGGSCDRRRRSPASGRRG